MGHGTMERDDYAMQKVEALKEKVAEVNVLIRELAQAGYHVTADHESHMVSFLDANVPVITVTVMQEL